MNRLKSAQARLKAAEKTIQQIECPAHKISVRVSGNNWELLKELPNRSATVNRALKAYFSPAGSERPPRQ